MKDSVACVSLVEGLHRFQQLNFLHDGIPSLDGSPRHIPPLTPSDTFYFIYLFIYYSIYIFIYLFMLGTIYFFLRSSIENQFDQQIGFKFSFYLLIISI